jgi:hypothetical protein
MLPHKRLKEVWEWRERAAKKTEGLAATQERRVIHATAEKYRKKLGLRVVKREHAHQ